MQRAPSDGRVQNALENHRAELLRYCQRMLGSAFDAEDAVQETLLRAWRSLDRFECRSSLRSWLYRIATNVCLDVYRGPVRRAVPVDPLTASTLSTDGDPAELTVSRDTVRLAFIAALGHLAHRQRAVLILRDVLRWPASDVAALLGVSVAATNSMLQRARRKMDAVEITVDDVARLDDGHRDLLARYVDAFERADVDRLIALLHHDATRHSAGTILRGSPTALEVR